MNGDRANGRGGAGVHSVPRAVWVAAASPLVAVLLLLATEAWVMLRLGQRPFDFTGAVSWVPFAFLGIAVVAVARRWWSGSRRVRIATLLAVSVLNVGTAYSIGLKTLLVAVLGRIPEMAVAGLAAVVVLLGCTIWMWVARGRQAMVPLR